MESDKKLCRACLTTKETFTNFIHQNVSQDLFWFCTAIKVLPDDTLPKAVCNACYERLIQFAVFKHTCIQSNDTLMHIAKDLKRDPVTDLESCDSKLLVQSFEVAVKAEYETSGLSQDDFLETDDNSEDFINKPKQKCKRKKSLKPRNEKRPFCFSCEHCNRKFVDADRYEGHKLMHMGKTVTIQCLPCKKIFHTWYSLTRHKKHVHTTVSLERLRCSLCGKVSKNEQTLQMHRMKHRAREEAVMCDVCGRVFKTKTILQVHLRTHDESRPRPFSCEQCGGKFHSLSSLRDHTRKRHNGQRFICELCGYPFREKFSLLKHILRHEGKKMYKCELCGKTFAGRSSLTDHKRLHSGEKPYPCPECNKRFITRRILVEHQRTHTGEKPHKCALCTHAFTQRGTLKRHMKVHEKPAPSVSYAVTETGIS